MRQPAPSGRSAHPADRHRARVPTHLSQNLRTCRRSRGSAARRSATRRCSCPDPPKISRGVADSRCVPPRHSDGRCGVGGSAARYRRTATGPRSRVPAAASMLSVEPSTPARGRAVYLRYEVPCGVTERDLQRDVDGRDGNAQRGDWDVLEQHADRLQHHTEAGRESRPENGGARNAPIVPQNTSTP